MKNSLKAAVGMMACIAIAFLYITSPQSTNTYASVGSASNKQPSIENQIQDLERSLQEATQRLLAAQGIAMAEQASALVQVEQRLDQKLTRAINEQIEGHLVSAKTQQACSNEDLYNSIKQMQEDIAALKAKQLTATAPVVKSTAGFGSTGSSAGGVAYSAAVAYPSVSSVVTGYGSTGSGYGSTGSAAVSYGSTGTSYSTTRTASYAVKAPSLGRWQNHDGLSDRQHAEIMHGIDTAGLTDQQVASMRDHDHDTYGPGHPPGMRASRTVTRTVSQAQSCPGGICPTNGSSSVATGSFGGRGLLGFRILGRGR